MKKKLVLLNAIFAIILGGVVQAAEEEDSSAYAGIQICAACHKDKFTKWLSSKHAGAANADAAQPAWNENGIECEACHGPGQEHVSKGGDASKIVSSKNADICGQCHGSGASGETGWKLGFRPGMQLSEIKDLKLITVDPSKLPPEPGKDQRLTYNMWLASGHSKALSRIVDNERESAECYRCHSADGFAAKRTDKTINMEQKGDFHTLTCVGCHDSHGSSHPSQLVMESEELCGSCHFHRAVLQGKGARGIEETRSFHSAIACVDCHMSEGNHLMRVLRPDNPELSKSRMGSCTACHKDNNRKARAEQLVDWHAWFDETMEPLEAKLEEVDALIKQNPDRMTDALEAKLDGINDNLSIIARDGSRGAHNLDYALEIMALSSDELDEIKAAIE
jgi:predicted CXXCH cytochrome family protein